MEAPAHNCGAPTSPSGWHFFQMSNRSPGTRSTELRGSSWRMSKQRHKSGDETSCKAVGGWGGGGGIGSQMTRSCCSLPVFCLLNKPVVFILWKKLATRFPVLALERLRPPPPTPRILDKHRGHMSPPGTGYPNLGLWTTQRPGSLA